MNGRRIVGEQERAEARREHAAARARAEAALARMETTESGARWAREHRDTCPACLRERRNREAIRQAMESAHEQATR